MQYHQLTTSISISLLPVSWIRHDCSQSVSGYMMGWKKVNELRMNPVKLETL